MTERELFDNPSRTSRFVMALRAYVQRSRKDLGYVFINFDFMISIAHGSFSGLLKRSLVDGVLAPTKQQRLQYAKWLHVYGKEKCSLTQRHAWMVDDFKVSDTLIWLYHYYC